PTWDSRQTRPFDRLESTIGPGPVSPPRVAARYQRFLRQFPRSRLVPLSVVPFTAISYLPPITTMGPSRMIGPSRCPAAPHQDIERSRKPEVGYSARRM